MIPQKKHDEAITSGNMQSATASIAMTAEMFELLSAGIYEDRPLAIIRELLCNARDAHKSVNSDKAIDIHLPNAFEPFLEIRDYGTGLSQEQMFEMYLSYGTSTKRDSNDQIGMFGIGSKSPLAYTDSFVVSSYQNGIEEQYSVYKDKGIPKIDKMYTASTEQADGLKIAISVKSQDYYTFKDRTETFSKLFDYPLNVTGATIHSDLEYSIKTDLYSVVKGYTQGAFALMGGVPYRLSSGLAEDLTKMFKVHTMIFHFEIGELNMASSRESLSFVDGDATDLAIKDRVKEVEKEFVKDMEKEIQGKTCIYDVVHTLVNTYGMERKGWNQTGKFTYGFIEWKNKSIDDWWEVINSSENIRQFTRQSDVSGKCGVGFFNGRILDEMILLHADMKTNNIKVARSFAKEARGRRVFLIDTNNKTFVPFMKETFGNRVKEATASVEFLRMYPKGSISTNTYTKVSGVFKVDRFGDIKEVTQLNGTETGCFVEMVRDNIELYGESHHKLGVTDLVRKGHIKDLYLIRKTSAKKNRPKGLVHLERELDSLMKKNLTSKVANRAAIERIWRQVNKVKTSVFPKVFDKILSNYPVLQFVNKTQEKHSKSPEHIVFDYLDSKPCLNSKMSSFDKDVTDRVDKMVKRYTKEFESLYSDYPVLGISSYAMDKPAREQIEELVLNSLK